MLARLPDEPDDCLAGATPYLKLFGTVAGGYCLAKGALAAVSAPSGNDGNSFLSGKKAVAHFYALNLLPSVHGLTTPVKSGAAPLFAHDPAA